MSYSQLEPELRAAGLTEMAEKARAFVYHDFKSPLVLPSMALANDLSREIVNDPENSSAIKAILDRHIAGHYDADVAESQAWMDSAEGQDALGKLMP